MNELFETETENETPRIRPLAARMRPKRMEDVLGQSHLLGAGKLLRRAIEADRLSSLILYGPPGCGKTSLAEVIALVTQRRFDRASGVTVGVPELRTLLREAELRLRRTGERSILFLDEIHRFNKAQQDVLLPHVEDGTITLIGATTHNPFFFINSPLTSRSQVFELHPLSDADIEQLLRRALAEPEGLGGHAADVEPEAFAHWARTCEGDARRALNALEIAVLTTPPNARSGRIRITRDAAAESIQVKPVVYDHDEDGHYDTLSAFIKSVRGSDPHAAVYWLAKMVHAGEDPRCIARRLVILAAEDIGNADPRGLTVAVSALHASEAIGMPEARILLAQATTYLATAPKSNAAYTAIENALRDVREGRTLPVPKALRGTSYRGAERLGHGGYRYAHEAPGHFVDQEYLPSDRVYYEPTDQGYEDTIRKRMAHWESLREKPRKPTPQS